jgi:hypothetical protein
LRSPDHFDHEKTDQNPFANACVQNACGGGTA